MLHCLRKINKNKPKRTDMADWKVFTFSPSCLLNWKFVPTGVFPEGSSIVIEFHSLSERELTLFYFFFLLQRKQLHLICLWNIHILLRKTLQGCGISNHILDTKWLNMQNSTVLTKKKPNSWDPVTSETVVWNIWCCYAEFWRRQQILQWCLLFMY